MAESFITTHFIRRHEKVEEEGSTDYLMDHASITYLMGPDGVFWAITIAFSLLAIASGLLFKRVKWKLKTV